MLTISDLDLAVAMTDRARRRVPAYADFLRRNGIDPGERVDAEAFTQLPVMTKAGYITRYPQPARYWDGRITEAMVWSSTSGSSSGVPTQFGRGALALEQSAAMYDRIFTDSFSSQPRTTLLINCFAMGTWIGGTYTMAGVSELNNRGHRLSVATPGIDLDVAVATLAELGPFYDHVVLAGYPPLIKDLLDNTPANLLAMDIKLLLAGEAITEKWRDHVLDLLHRHSEPERICLKYGTADAGLMGYETPASIAVRRAALADAALSEQLFGPGITAQPTFVRYHPEYRYTECDAEGHLLFTVDSAMPLIRYRINDRGRILDGAQLDEILRAHGHDDLAGEVEPHDHFLVLHGRTDIAAIFHSLNVYPANLRPAFEDPAFAADLTGRFVVEVLESEQHHQTLHIRAELAKNTAADAGLARALRERCHESLVTTNSEFRALSASLGKAARPTVSLYEYHSAGFGSGAKDVYIRGAAR
ncbi:hypothetical protein QNM97_24375 [Gordonia sp. L191]|uniref:hypothetical protein n=1 Tax=Gordonia sp. L191 TaxID=2982699 RepID=UPI0024BFC6D2|nr:hypothetical protein [Gordonia sp. L191]WHU47050.1 hypothetical protein QNM97_24375 [Gordonia sp. L191]